jgi:hypothetical protein
MYPSDYVRDTRVLSLAAKGGWFDVLCHLHSSSTRGTATLPVIGWARIMGASVDQADAVITELDGMRIADVIRHDNGDVTLSSRRMMREYITREQTRLRVERHRAKEACNAGGNADVTGQKTETKKTETKNNTNEERTVIPLLLSTHEFAAAWGDWLQHRREKRCPVKPGSVSEKQQLKKLEEWGVERAIAAIRYSIGNDWQGLFEEGLQGSGGKVRDKTRSAYA